MVSIRLADGDTCVLPGLAPVAIQQGRHVASVVADRLAGRPTVPFRYHDKGNLATIGRAKAVADVQGVKLSGFIAWATWLTVHLWYLIGFENRLLVVIRWAWSFFAHGRGVRLITGEPERAPHDLAALPVHARSDLKRLPGTVLLLLDRCEVLLQRPHRDHRILAAGRDRGPCRSGSSASLRTSSPTPRRRRRRRPAVAVRAAVPAPASSPRSRASGTGRCRPAPTASGSGRSGTRRAGTAVSPAAPTGCSTTACCRSPRAAVRRPRASLRARLVQSRLTAAPLRAAARARRLSARS